ncbi:hypothetical protein [Salmonirosea aquatica]|uniref:Uncharacterized protein n=1 Tax=Salmonirosea aquatica TaxID=2654236 RepID=A0A7C9F4I0_9BACT|nr:hypothetical protein [Cytophagaceae bacterium SJW1-29]
MDRKEIDQETKETKNTKNILFWIVGIGIVLSIIAFAGGLFNHGGDVTPKTDQTGTMMSDTVAGDQMADTLATDIRK